MIISDKHEFVFLATPRTGSTAIINELCKNYAGRRILDKHSNYPEFLRIANEKQKKYFVFAGVRNPMDDSVSMYKKLETNHQKSYTNPDEWIENGGWVTKRMRRLFRLVQNPETSFKDFLLTYYRTPYTSRININRRYCSYILRFENLQISFSNALEMIGVKQVRPLPIVNPTRRRRDFLDYYHDPKAISHAAKVFAPFMFEWGYQFPDERYYEFISPLFFSVYQISKTVRKTYSLAREVGIIPILDRIPI